MNKALLLIICDFLLISLLALAKFDVEEASKKVEAQPETSMEAGPESDLIDALKMSLEEERVQREQLDALLRQAQQDLQSNQSRLEEREKEVELTQQQLAEQEARARQLAAEQTALQAKLAQSQTKLGEIEEEYTQSRERLSELQRQYATTQASMESLEKRYESTQDRLEDMQKQFETSVGSIEQLQSKLASAQSEARINQQLVEELQTDLTQRVQENTQLQGAIQQLDKERQVVLLEKEQMAGQLKVVETEQRMTQVQLQTAQKQIEEVREEKAVIQEQATKLADNVANLADQSVQLTEEVRQARPLTPNTIFSEFTSNRVHSTVQAARAGLFGQRVEREAAIRTVLFSNGQQTFAVYHLKETPFDFTAVGTEWESIFVTLRHGGKYQSLEKISFLDRDPRILIAPVTDEQVKELTAAVYTISSEMFKFEGAVLVGADENYYGECDFQIDPETPGYMRMQRERFGRLFGKFVPSRGDLVFSKTGELIGIMANNEYCLVLDSLQATRSLKLGSSVPKQLVSAYFSQMYFQLEDMPLRLR